MSGTPAREKTVYEDKKQISLYKERIIGTYFTVSDLFKYPDKLFMGLGFEMEQDIGEDIGENIVISENGVVSPFRCKPSCELIKCPIPKCESLNCIHLYNAHHGHCMHCAVEIFNTKEDIKDKIYNSNYCQVCYKSIWNEPESGDPNNIIVTKHVKVPGNEGYFLEGHGFVPNEKVYHYTCFAKMEF